MKTYGKIDSFKKMNIKVILNDKDVIYEGNVKGCRLPCTKVHGLVPLYWKYILRVNSL